MRLFNWFKRPSAPVKVAPPMPAPAILVEPIPAIPASPAPTRPSIVMQFVPMRDFFSSETNSQYTQGLRYTVREGNTKLAACVEQWIASGWVQRAVGPAAKIHGKGA